jgi:regulator of sigma E protease
MNFLAAIILSIVIVAFQGVPDSSNNIYVAKVEDQSPAQGAGWLPGDAIYAVDGEVITSSSQLQSAISGHEGEEVAVTVRRGNELVETTVTPRKDPPANQGATGIQMVQGSPSILKITQVDPGSVAAGAGWQDGDQIVAIDGIQLEAEAQARNVLASRSGEEIAVTIERDGQQFDTAIVVPGQAISLTQVLTDSAASDALLYPGDEIVSIGGEPVADADAFLDRLTAAAGSTVPVEVMREGRDVTVDLAVPVLEEGQNPLDAIGANARVESPYEALGTDGVIARVYDKVSLSEVIPEGWAQFWDITSGTFEGLQTMVTDGVDPDTLVGPVGMGQMTSELLTQSATPVWVTLALITVVISVALGVLNLLPLPALDGGRLLFVLIEVLRGGRRISPEKEGMVHLAGMLVLLGLMFFVAFGDVSRLVDGRSIFP